MNEDKKETQAESLDSIADRLMNLWCETHDGHIDWHVAVEIVAVVTGMGEAHRARLLGVGDGAPQVATGTFCQAALDAAVAAEREACAKLCESRTSSAVIAAGPRDRFGLAPVDQVIDRMHEGTKCAAAIRARGEQAKESGE